MRVPKMGLLRSGTVHLLLPLFRLSLKEAERTKGDFAKSVLGCIKQNCLKQCTFANALLPSFISVNDR